MKTVMITAPSSNTGKTIITLGLLRAINNRGIDISAFKTGPDFIDGKYLERASRKDWGSLDMHMMGRKGLEISLALNHGDYGIVEGAMGYFDGISNTFENSSYHIARELDIPSILVYKPEGEMFSAIPKIRGMVDFPGSNIEAIILNKVNESIYIMLKEAIEEYIGIEVLGYLPNNENLKIDNKSLGLEKDRKEASERVIQVAAEMVEKTINIDRILEIGKDINIREVKIPNKRKIEVAVAKDDAFSFHYNENLKILDKMTNLRFFSPLYDRKLPSSDLVYIGGGYPEIYLEELSKNKSIMNSIKQYVDLDGYLIAEGEGLLYLNKTLENYPMVGIFSGKGSMIDRLERFGYTNIHTTEKIFGGGKFVIKGNEYHKSKLETEENPIFKITKPKSNRNWKCGYRKNNTLAYFQHLNLLGNLKLFDNLLDIIERDGKSNVHKETYGNRK